jgi:hypothetical protein
MQPDLAAAFERVGKFYEEALADGDARKIAVTLKE